MTLKTILSAAAARTASPSISGLMKIALERPEIVSLAAGFVDQESLPTRATAAALTEILGDETAGKAALQYGTTVGDEALREILVGRLEAQHGVPAGRYREVVPHVVMTTGSAQLIYLVGEALLDPGDIVIVESPTYFVFLGPLETRGARAIRVATDDGGLRLDELERTLQAIQSRGELGRVKLLYTVPEHSNPSGVSLALDRRKPLLELMKRWSATAGRRIPILEDSAYHGLSYYGRPEAPSIWSMDREGESVILARTFSKTFSPGLKLGYGVIPPSLIGTVLALKGNHDFGSSNLAQKLIREVLADGAYDRHVEGLRTMYARKLDAFLEALDREFAAIRDRVSWTRPRGGLYVWMTLPDEVDTGFDGPLFQRCLDDGVIYVPGEYAFAPEPTPPPKNHMRLAFGVPDAPTLVEGARRLAGAVRATIG